MSKVPHAVGTVLVLRGMGYVVCLYFFKKKCGINACVVRQLGQHLRSRHGSPGVVQLWAKYLSVRKVDRSTSHGLQPTSDGLQSKKHLAPSSKARSPW